MVLLAEEGAAWQGRPLQWEGVQAGGGWARAGGSGSTVTRGLQQAASGRPNCLDQGLGEQLCLSALKAHIPGLKVKPLSVAHRLFLLRKTKVFHPGNTVPGEVNFQLSREEKGVEASAVSAGSGHLCTERGQKEYVQVRQTGHRQTSTWNRGSQASTEGDTCTWRPHQHEKGTSTELGRALA